MKKGFLDANSTIQHLKTEVSNIENRSKIIEQKLFKVYQNLKNLNQKIKEKLKWIETNAKVSQNNQ